MLSPEARYPYDKLSFFRKCTIEFTENKLKQIEEVSKWLLRDRYSDRRVIVPFRRGLDSRIEPMPFTPKDFAEGGILIDEIKKRARQHRVSFQC